MNERIKHLRKDILGLTQQEFADQLNIKRGAIANYEIGRNTPIDAVISLICRTYNVNENWLRYNEGEPLMPQTMNQEIQAFANEVMASEDASFRKRFVHALSHTSVGFWKELERIAIECTEKD